MNKKCKLLVWLLPWLLTTTLTQQNWQQKQEQEQEQEQEPSQTQIWNKGGTYNHNRKDVKEKEQHMYAADNNIIIRPVPETSQHHRASTSS